MRHRSDHGLVLSAQVTSGRAVTQLLAVLAAAMPQSVTRRLREERLQRISFTATRSTISRAPAIVAVRNALATTAHQIAAKHRDVDLLVRPTLRPLRTKSSREP